MPSPPSTLVRSSSQFLVSRLSTCLRSAWNSEFHSTNPKISLFEMNFSDVKILSEKYSSEFHDRLVQDIPEEEYQLAIAGYTK